MRRGDSRGFHVAERAHALFDRFAKDDVVTAGSTPAAREQIGELGDELEVADLDNVARGKQAVLYRPAIDEGAVTASQVAHPPVALVVGKDFGMPARDFDAVEADRNICRATDQVAASRQGKLPN